MSRKTFGSMATSMSRDGVGPSSIKRRRARMIANRMKAIPTTKKSLNSSVSGVQEGNSGSGCIFQQALIQNSSNFRKSGAPSRFMFFCNDEWNDFSKEVVESLKEGFTAGMPTVEGCVEGSKFLFDFLRMLQIDVVTGHERSIGWIDVEGQCFFPKFFVDNGIETVREVPPCRPNMEIEVRIRNDSLKEADKSSASRPLVEHIAYSLVGNLDKPLKPSIESATPAISFEGTKWPHVQMLEEGDNYYMCIKNLFLSGMNPFIPDVTVTSIGRCSNLSPIGIVRSKTFESQIEITKTARGSANVKLAWYGISSAGVAFIAAHGFLVPSRYPNSSTKAIGVYLSPLHLPHLTAALSPADGNGEKHIIVCRVILGNTEKFDAEKLQFSPGSENYDCGVDDLSNPRWYWIWITHMSRHILPEYVASFKSPNQQQQQQQGLPRAPIMIPFCKLVAELGKILSSSKFCELLIIYEQRRAGRMTKEMLQRKVRLLVGDQILRATLQRLLEALK